MRERNEDNYLLLSAPAIAPQIDGLFVVADGMGGHQAGHVASQYLVDRLHELFSSSAYSEDVHYSHEHADYFAAVLKEVLERVNEELYNLASSQTELRGMGTTATVALLTSQRLFIGHVGDSRAYLLRDGALRQLTEDHSWVAEQVRDGSLTWAEAVSHPRKNVLTRSLGSSLVVRIDRAIHELQVGDRLLMCSDGLTNHLTDAEMRQALTTQSDPQAVCDWLVNLANQRGGSDNITVLVVHFTPDATPPSLNARRTALLGAPVEPTAPATTQKLVRPKTRRRLVSSKTAQRLWRTAGVVLLSFGLGAVAYFLVPWVIEISMPEMQAEESIALLVGVGTAGLLLMGITLGILLANLWSISDEARTQGTSPPTPSSQSRQET